MSHFEKVYFDDLMNDEALNLVSDSAWKLWVKMFLYMGTKSPQRGRLLLPGNGAVTEPQLARILATEIRKLRRCLGELERHHVFSRDEEGVIVCRRQLREVEVSARMAELAKKSWDARAQNVPQNERTSPLGSEVLRIAKRTEESDAASGIWHLASSDPDSSLKEGVQREGATPPPIRPPQPECSPTPAPAAWTTKPAPTAEEIEGLVDFGSLGWRQVAEIWNTNCGDLPKIDLDKIEPALGRRIDAMFSSGTKHYRTRAWWVELSQRASKAKFKRWGVSVISLWWLLSKDEHIAALMSGDYDNATDAAPRDNRGNVEPKGEYQKYVHKPVML